MIYTRNFLTAEEKEGVEEMLTSIAGEYLEMLDAIEWIAEEDRNDIMSYMENFTLILGMPGDYHDDAIFEKFDSGKNVSAKPTAGELRTNLMPDFRNSSKDATSCLCT